MEYKIIFTESLVIINLVGFIVVSEITFFFSSWKYRFVPFIWFFYSDKNRLDLED